MIRKFIAITALGALAACGDGNPFDTTITDDDVVAGDIPEDVAGTVAAFAYDPSAGTLTIRGLLRDEDITDVVYTRKPGLDRGVYQAFTAQDDPLDEHTTVYVRELGAVSGANAVTGGQFTYYSGGVNYKRDGAYQPHPVSDASDTGLVTYTGEYIGLSNLNGPDTDLLPVPAGAGGGPVSPAQASVVRGRAFINVGFAEGNVAGTVDQRVIELDSGDVPLPFLTLVPTSLADDGTFTDVVELEGTRQVIGTYSGILGGEDSNVLAGGLYVEEHFSTAIPVTGETEHGLFVLGKCGGAFEDSSPDCDAADD